MAPSARNGVDMIEVIGPATVATFDGHVLELFGPDGSTRLHTAQLRRVAIGSLGMLLPMPILEVHTIDDERFALPFAIEQSDDLERLLEALPVGARWNGLAA
jgi:hypothetical protein